MLKLRDVKAGYGKSEVLQGVTLDVNVGEVVTLVGANGAGKTTTLKTLCGIVQARSGSIDFEGIQISSHEPHDIVELGITMIPEGRQLFPFLTVEDNLLMGAYKLGARKNHKERMERVLTIFPRVKERLAQLAGSLSGGEQQMVAIARGMMAEPRLLVFDEPSLGLSPLLVEQMFEVIRTVANKGTTVLLVEQNVFHTLQIADRGYVLENGAVTLTGTGKELLENPHVRRAYLGH
ncbi:branched-chain amino acid ABC transporter ATP-binding protein [Limnohabitans sp. TS-CS-82]|uniref:ABC transporter ATP-binding protein n=1 Tax=Limnohabitans sp. TS-CS-82 TaxID=2094193 RepID=UPI000CF2F50A|nr:ABC transporter ATP-binding protein [Limnohabitans sp. TS-CS-82]PQA80476.1 branched-chain amino acid ABC transporter ATP-binding protein [Limnohabitans sp. TS-CS-82]